MHAELFGDKRFLEVTELCQIRFGSDAVRARALWEWLYFGLYVIVEGIRGSTAGNHQIGQAISSEVCARFHVGLRNAGLGDMDLRSKKAEITLRFDCYDSVVRAGQFERLGFAVASAVLGLDLTPGTAPPTFDAYELSIAANQSYLGGLKAVNELFSTYAVAL